MAIIVSRSRLSHSHNRRLTLKISHQPISLVQASSAGRWISDKAKSAGRFVRSIPGGAGRFARSIPGAQGAWKAAKSVGYQVCTHTFMYLYRSFSFSLSFFKSYE